MPAFLHYKESCGSFRLPASLRGYVEEAASELMMDRIRPEIRMLTANKVTRNYTLYPTESLRGKPAEGTGLISFVRPYSVPFIRDHNTYSSKEVYGRVNVQPTLVESSRLTYLQVQPDILDRTAIENILAGLWTTVSLGSRCMEAYCSICRCNLVEAYCDHDRGQSYTVEGKSTPQVCYHEIGPIRAVEGSFVLVPSDDEAMVTNPNVMTNAEAARTSQQLKLVRLIVPTRDHRAFDLLGKRLLSCEASAVIFPARPTTFLFQGFNAGH